MSGSGCDEPPRGKRQRLIPKKPIADCYHESMGWGNLHFPSIEDIVERVDILSAARLAVGMVGMRHAIRGTPNLPLHAPGLLHSDEFWWPHDRDAPYLIQYSCYIYIMIFCLFMFLQSTDLSVEHLSCIDFLDTIISENVVTPPMTPFLVTVYGLSFPSCMCLWYIQA
jgi:hypothetical protein